jgi:hypothetical protein
MAAISTILRHLIVAILLAGLAIAGLPPCVLTAGNCPSAAIQHGPKTCCCKGKCGTHCKMACCQAPAPAQDRAPAPTKLADDGSVSWGLAAGAALQLDAIAGAEFRRGSFRPGAWVAAPDSLLNLSIRLNV